jgi:hypothetical protein
MHKNQRVADMAVDVLARQARARVKQTGEPFEEALEGVLETEAGRQLRELRDGPHRDKRAQEGQESITRERAVALGWPSSNKVPGSPVDVSQRGPR